MAAAKVINSLEQLKPFLNKDGVLEIAIRGKKKRFIAFQKLAINNATDTETKELLNKAFVAINQCH